MAEPDTPAKSAIPARVILLCDDQSLRAYGPVLRRLCVGLLDEVADLNLFCLGDSDCLAFAPCPPVRVIRATCQYYEMGSRVELNDRRVEICGTRLPTLDALLPGRRLAHQASVLAEYKPTLIHAMSEHLESQARALAQLLNIPCLVSVLSLTASGHHPNPAAVNGILPASSQVLRQFRTRYPSCANQIRFVPIGTHVPNAISSFAHPGRIPQMICISPFRQGLGLEVLIDAIRIQADENPDFALALSGQGPMEQRLRHKVTQLKLNEIVHFVEPVNQLLQNSDALKTILSTYDLYIMSHEGIQWQPELLEAMSVGNTIIAPKGACPDLVSPDRTALTFRSGDSNSLAQALLTALNNRDLSRKLAVNAQRHLQRHFLASHMVSRLGRIYRRTIDSYRTNPRKTPASKVS